MSVDFPPALKLNRLSFANNILVHLRGRTDINMGHIGQRLGPLLSSYRQILPEYLDNFYEMLTGICTHLEKYSSLAESCSKSGAYQDRRQEQLNTVLTLIIELEKQDDVMVMLENMRRK